MNRPRIAANGWAFTLGDRRRCPSGAFGARLESLAQGDESKVEAATVPQHAVYLLFSFDLVGSTALKAATPSWIDETRIFYEIVHSAAAEHLKKAVHWKFVGDEVLLAQRVDRKEDIPAALNGAHAVLQKAWDRMENTVSRSANLSVKAVLWMIVAKTIGGNTHERDASIEIKLQKKHTDVVITPSPYANREGVLDYIGPSTDIGFRLSMFARRRQLVVGGSLADYLRQRNMFSDELRVVGFSVLKGVCGGAPQPGIWYRSTWDAPRNDFSYEDRYADPIVARATDDPTKLDKAAILSDVRMRAANDPVYFDADLIDEIIQIDADRLGTSGASP